MRARALLTQFQGMLRHSCPASLVMELQKVAVKLKHMWLFLAGALKRGMKEVFTQVYHFLAILKLDLTSDAMTAMRHTWEEIGLDLAERDFTCIGQLDDREITTSLGKRLLMILSPFVFLQLTPKQLPTEPMDGTTIHWVPLEALVSAVFPRSVSDEAKARSRWSSVSVDAASRITPRHSAVLNILVRVLIGSMQFPAILLDLPEPEGEGPSTSSPSSAAFSNRASYRPLTQDKLEKGFTATKPRSKDRTKSRRQLKLWGLSLGMALDLMATMVPPPTLVSSTHSQKSSFNDSDRLSSSSLQLPFHPVGGEGVRIEALAPSLASVFPRFSYPDVNFWIW